MARPEIEIDLDKLKSLMRLSPNLEDTANFFDCSPDTIERRIREHFQCSFAEFRDKNAVHTRMSIKRKMIEKAVSGDNTMLIWLSKNMLGMADKLESKVINSFESLTDEQLEAKLRELREKVK